MEKEYLRKNEWEELTPEEKKIKLFLNQKDTLRKFLERGAITKAQYDKSYGDLVQKMDMKDFEK